MNQEESEEQMRMLVIRALKPTPESKVNSSYSEAADHVLGYLLGGKVTFDPAQQLYRFRCPHCLQRVEVLKNQIACQIFRHAFYYQLHPQRGLILTQQISPHMPKAQCDRLVAQGKVVGCAKPFKFVYGPDGNHHVEECDYI
jgi:hypothetical protein